MTLNNRFSNLNLFHGNKHFMCVDRVAFASALSERSIDTSEKPQKTSLIFYIELPLYILPLIILLSFMLIEYFLL